jgi:O-antigen/teichoic acid export membrane protein
MWRTGRALFVAQVVAGGLGALAWLVAARTHGAAEVGTALAVVAALTWAGLAGNLGLGSLLIGLLPSARRLERPLLAGVGVATATATGAVLGVAGALVLGLVGGEAITDAVSLRSPGVVAAIVLGAAAWAGGVVADQVAIACGRPALAVARAATSGIGRLVWLAAALVLDVRSAGALIAGWSFALAAGTLVAVVGLWSSGDLTVPRRAATAIAGPLAARAVRTHHLINVLGQTPPMALPVVLAGSGRPVQAAAFGAAWQVASIVGLLSPSVATGLFAAGSADRPRAAALGVQARRQVLAVVGGAALVLAVVAPLLLSLIGPRYASEGTWALRILAVGLLADATANLDVAQLRIARRYRRAAAVNGAIAVTAVLGAIVVAPTAGAAGAAAAWLLGQIVGCLVAAGARPSTDHLGSDHEDLARLRLVEVEPGERRGAGDRAAGDGPAVHRAGGRRPPRHRRRPAAWTGVRYGPWSGAGGAPTRGGRAS